MRKEFIGKYSSSGGGLLRLFTKVESHQRCRRRSCLIFPRCNPYISSYSLSISILCMCPMPVSASNLWEIWSILTFIPNVLHILLLLCSSFDYENYIRQIHLISHLGWTTQHTNNIKSNLMNPWQRRQLLTICPSFVDDNILLKSTIINTKYQLITHNIMSHIIDHMPNI